jgi:hypothetical protein
MSDNWTQIPDAKDSHRYKAIGNSMAVPVMRWIGEGIAAVDSLILDHPPLTTPHCGSHDEVAGITEAARRGQVAMT